jgi:acetyltransferase-like isoleucine patch superfamily enzyme
MNFLKRFQLKINNKNLRLSKSATIRIDDGGRLDIGRDVVIDDDVRIVISNTGSVIIGDNVKIGKGTIINCGGDVIIGSGTAIYGYCMLQSSIWIRENSERVYKHGAVKIGESCVISPYSLLSLGTNIEDDTLIPPRANTGEWLSFVGVD